MKLEIYQYPDCGTRREIWRRDGRLRKKDHKKKLFCAGCHQPVQFKKED